MTTKKIRKPGELVALVGTYLSKKPEAKPKEVAEALGLTYANAKNACRRWQNARNANQSRVVVDSNSALGQLMKPLRKVGRPRKEVVEQNLKTAEQNLNDQRFVGILSLIGLSRAEELIAIERRKIQQLLKGASA